MPPRRLSTEEFAAALQRGHGRALLHVREYGLADVAELVLQACLHNQAYDSQAEGSRAGWLHDMFKDTREYPRFSAAIRSALADETDTSDLQQLCELAMLMAEGGDQDAHAALRARVLRLAASQGDNWVGSSELVRLDGTDGVVQLARCYGKLLIQDPEENPPPIEALFFCLDGTIPVELPGALEKLSDSEPEIRAYLDYDLRYRQGRANNLNSELALRERTRLRYPLQQILADATKAVGEFSGRYMSFGKYATAEELETVFQRLLTEQDERICVRLLWIFRRAEMPWLDPRLWQFAASANRELRDAAIEALARLRDDSIGEYARYKLRSGKVLEADSSILALLVRNYRLEDGNLIGAALRDARPDAASAHSIGWAILDIAAENHRPELLEALHWVYQHTPCSNCREKAVRHMLSQGKTAPEILAECRYDAVDDIRKMARVEP